MSMTNIVEQTEAIVRERMDGLAKKHGAAGHGMDHVLRVLASARAIQAEAGGDLAIVELAALLHDVGDAKFHDGDIEPAYAIKRQSQACPGILWNEWSYRKRHAGSSNNRPSKTVTALPDS